MMPHYRHYSPRHRRQHGVGLVTAIFLLVALAGLAVAGVTLFTSQQVTSSLDVLGARAYQAARAGIEWGVYQQLRNNQCKSQMLAMPAGTSLEGFSVNVTCTAVTQSGAGDLTRWVIKSTACNVVASTCVTPPNRTDYVSRTLEVQL